MKNKLLYKCTLIVGLMALGSCESYFEPDADDILLEENYIGNTNELYSGYMGIAAKVQTVADQGVFLSELRGDFLEPTDNAPQELWDIYNHTISEDNSFADPSGYYDVINNANNYIRKAFEYKESNPDAVEDAVFEPLVSGAIRFKVWSYLMLAKLYGEAVYLDQPLTKEEDISKYPVMQFDELIGQLISLMEGGVNGIDGKKVLVWSDLLFPGVSTSAQDLTWNMICPSPSPLLIELYLWNGNYEQVVSLGMSFIYDQGSGRYKLGNDDYNGEWIQFFYRDPITKTRELINIVPFDYQRHQTNHLIDFFSNTEPNKYYLRPTEVAMQRFQQQVRQDGITIGDRYRGEDYTYWRQNGEWVVRKFSRAHETADNIYKNDVHIALYRAGDIHLFIAEALNQMEKFKEAEAFLNDGVQNYLSKNEGNLQYPLDNETYNAAININWGVRRRVDLGPVFPEGLSKDELDTPEKVEEYKKGLDSLLLEETCMESAGEARSYFAMIRMAKRWGDPSMLADRVSAKYPAGKRESIRSLLMQPENWFVDYDLSK
ncbi:RagB/SusD family nutrient uptake outer membrane protein [Echinicola sp. CAU 1574]|uniref:RagB/SusD family nutrient uptake outer membrane protein n=1 Tax=Echinicola arenosa TaxID=2774144 RepID=A0ABR9API6_9BACT|nr:RagB/SusD family nutrient uptake outer membrane protein [Echinicola arenosa]MBD8490691.1 RagB/SusD family nutrient uptake outer membrane protein [Echinicola arenosa]